MKTKKLVKLSLLTSISLVLFVIELKIPSLVPIPGVKLGLANIVTVFAVYCCTPLETALMLLSRITLGAIFCGTPISFIYSLSGAAFCFVISELLKSIIPIKKMWITSIFGAIFHGIGQILTALIVLKSTAILAYFPIILFSGCICGMVCGLCATYVTQRISRFID